MMPDDFGPVINGRDNVWDDFVPFVRCPPWVGACMTPENTPFADVTENPRGACAVGPLRTSGWGSYGSWFRSGPVWARWGSHYRALLHGSRCATGPVRFHRDRCSP